MLTLSGAGDQPLRFTLTLSGITTHPRSIQGEPTTWQRQRLFLRVLGSAIGGIRGTIWGM
eukprot:2702537-Rhodomonas_salina.1